MKNYILILAASLLLVLSGCKGVTPQEFDPVDTGEIIGFTYLLTKSELSEDNRESVEKAYAIFAEVANEIEPDGNVDVKSLLFRLIDERMPTSNDNEIAQKSAVKIIINRYWRKVDAEYGLDSRIPAEQIAMIRQVYIGIERGLGRGVE